MDILEKLKSQVGDDVQYIFDQEALFKEAIEEIQKLRQEVKYFKGYREPLDIT